MPSLRRGRRRLARAQPPSSSHGRTSRSLPCMLPSHTSGTSPLTPFSGSGNSERAAEPSLKGIHSWGWRPFAFREDATVPDSGARAFAAGTRPETPLATGAGEVRTRVWSWSRFRHAFQSRPPGLDTKTRRDLNTQENGPLKQAQSFACMAGEASFSCLRSNAWERLSSS